MDKQHHSLTDWDFLIKSDWSPFIHYGLWVGRFVSPPSCLRFDPQTPVHEQYALSNLALAQDLKAGKIITYAIAQSAGLGDSFAYIGITGPGETGIALEIQKRTSAWFYFRADWWQGFDTLNQPATLVTQWTWDGTNWIWPSETIHPPMTGLVNRVGIGCTTQSLGADKFFDDTEIWLPV